MGLFGRSEESRQIASENRQYNYGREQNLVSIGNDPEAERLWMIEKEAKEDLLKWQQNLFDEVEELRHNLRNEIEESPGVWVGKTELKSYNLFGKAQNQFMKPLLNEKGVQMIITECKPLMSRNMFNSNLSEERILKMLEMTANTISDNIADYCDEYDADFRNWDHVLRISINAMLPGAFRSINGWNKKMDSTMSKHLEANVSQEGGAQKKSFFGQMMK